MGTQRFVSSHSPLISSSYEQFRRRSSVVKMKFLVVFLALAAVVCAEENKPSPVGQCFVDFINCAAKADDFMGKAECVKDFSSCVSEACRIPVCWDAHAKCRTEAKGFVDYFWCNVHYMKCMHEHCHERCKPHTEA